MRRVLFHPTTFKALTFGVVGLSNTVIDFAVFATAVQAFATPPVLANILAWLIAVSCSYVLNTMITFRLESGRRLRRDHYLKFLGAGVVGMTAATATLALLSEFVPLLFAKAAAIGVAFIINFSMSHFIVFRPRRPIEPS